MRLFAWAILSAMMAASPLSRAAEAEAAKAEVTPATKAETKAEIKAGAKSEKAERKARKGPEGEVARPDRLGQLSKALSLTDEQKGKVKTILADERTAMKDLREKKAEPKEMAKVRAETAKKIKEILTPDQVEKFDKMQPKARPAAPAAPKKAKKTAV